MASIIDLDRRRQSRRQRPARATPLPGRSVRCIQCGERHPIVRVKRDEARCMTAFFDGTHWFCLNRGCRRTWLARQREPT
jgi:hypothetical protein